MGALWLTEGGLAIDDEGQVYICDDCPCGGRQCWCAYWFKAYWCNCYPDDDGMGGTCIQKNPANGAMKWSSASPWASGMHAPYGECESTDGIPVAWYESNIGTGYTAECGPPGGWVYDTTVWECMLVGAECYSEDMEACFGHHLSCPGVSAPALPAGSACYNPWGYPDCP